jgi:hypothetical protein
MAEVEDREHSTIMVAARADRDRDQTPPPADSLRAAGGCHVDRQSVGVGRRADGVQRRRRDSLLRGPARGAAAARCPAGRNEGPVRGVHRDLGVQVEYSAPYGLGITIEHTPCGVAYGRKGDVPGYRNVFWATADGRRVVAVMVNESTQLSWSTVRRAAETAFCSG